MGAITVSQNREAELAIPIAKQESRIAGNATAMRDVAVAFAHLRPPR